MKKIIFVINNLETGGVQISLCNLLKEIAHRYDITLLVFAYREKYKDMLPQNIKIRTVRSPFRQFGISTKDTKGHPLLFLERLFWWGLTRLFGVHFAGRMMCLFQKKLKGYDCAVSYLHEQPFRNFYGGCNIFVLKRIEAPRKITWIHCDFQRCGANNRQNRALYTQFDKIVACSNGTKEAFLNCMPALKDKCVAIRNCNDYANIRAMAEVALAYDKQYFQLVTVARLSAEKGIERALKAVKYARNCGYRLEYHVVGGGESQTALQALSEKLGIADCVTFHGNQKNPYAYMANADLFLLPSYHEAAPMVFDEAGCLGVPVLATETTSVQEMLSDCGHGIVCPNSEEGICCALVSLLEDPNCLSHIKIVLAESRFDNAMSVQRFDAVVCG